MSIARAKPTQIADVLGLPVEALLDPTAQDGDLGDARELMRLWLMIRSTEDRRTVLEAIRNVVETQGKGP